MGNKVGIKGLYVLLLVFAASLASLREALSEQIVPNLSCSPTIFSSMAVFIENRMEDKSVLKLHCKSKDDDMGEHNLYYGQHTRFVFRPSPFGRTRFWCDVFWNNKWVAYDAYIEKRDFSRCYHNHCNCQWGITSKGPCLWDKTSKQYSICESWKTV